MVVVPDPRRRRRRDLSGVAVGVVAASPWSVDLGDRKSRRPDQGEPEAPRRLSVGVDDSRRAEILTRGMFRRRPAHPADLSYP